MDKQAPAPALEEEEGNDLSEKTTITLRIPRDLLGLVDASASRRFISRTAWMLYALSQAVEHNV